MTKPKLDVKKAYPSLYAPRNSDFARIHVPSCRYLAIDGIGDPDHEMFAIATAALYSVAYTVKFACKASGGQDYVVPPLEALWYAEDPRVFVSGDRGDWRWTLLSYLPEWIDDAVWMGAQETIGRKKVPRAHEVEIVAVNEGDAFQAMHVGPYAAEAEKLARLHDTVMPEAGVTFNGPHHEIYLSDPRRTDPAKLRTVLRQPVRPK